MKRRALLTGLAGAAAWPFAARAQQPAALPVVGFLNQRSRANGEKVLAAFLSGLGESGIAEGRDVVIEYRWAEDRMDKLPELAAELVRLKVAVIAVGGTGAAMAAMAATKTIPIVFGTGGDPVRLGLVTSLNRPTGNATGVTFYPNVLVPKMIELLNEIVPNAKTLGILVNPQSPVTESAVKDARAAAQALGKELRVLSAASLPEFDTAFASLAQSPVDGLLLAADPLFDSWPEKIVALAARYAVPAVYYGREFVDAGGLMSYGAERIDAYRQIGIYTAQILKGAKPVNLRVVQPTTFRLAINRKAANALGLAIPTALLARADEVIE